VALQILPPQSGSPRPRGTASPAG